MADEQKDQAENQAVAEETVVESPTTKGETQTQGEATAPEESSEQVKNLPSEEGEHKSRLDKRIEQLEEKGSRIGKTLEKLKQVANQGEAKTGLPPELQQNAEPLIKPGEEEIAPEDLEQRIAQREQLQKEAIKREIRAEMEWRQGVKNHLDDLEKIKEIPELNKDSDKYDPKLEALVAEEYEVRNTVVDPMSGQRVFVPRVTATEIYKKFKDLLDKKKDEGATETAGKLVEQISQSAVAPSQRVREAPPDLEQLRKEMVKNPGKVAKILESKLPKSED